MSFFETLFESEEEEKKRLELERRMRKRAEEAEEAAGLEKLPTLIDNNAEDNAAADAAEDAAVAAREQARAAREAERRDKAREAVRQEAVREGAALDEAARRDLTERIRIWNEQIFVDDTDFLLFTPKKKALEKQAQYHALVAAHEKLFANRYIMNDESGVPQYFYIYPTEQLWMSRPRTDIVWMYLSDAIEDLKKQNKDVERSEMKSIRTQYESSGTYKSPETVPPEATLCPETKSTNTSSISKGCASQGGGKKSKSKYSRKSKSKYSRKY